GLGESTGAMFAADGAGGFEVLCDGVDGMDMGDDFGVGGGADESVGGLDFVGF
ncbi:hypothetical protein TeGR_g9417, partial [Tetraparma gracilis]